MSRSIDRFFCTTFFAMLVALGAGGFRAEPVAAALPMTVRAFIAGDLQRALERKVARMVTARAALTRAYGQLLWSGLSASPPGRSFVIGKGGELYGGVSIAEYCVGTIAKDDGSEYRRFAEDTAKLARLLRARGIAFVAITTPSKPVVVPERIPRALCAEGESPRRDATRLLAALRRADVPLIDGALLTKRTASESGVRPFRAQGIHWNSWGARPTANELLRVVATDLGDPVSHIDVSELNFVDESVESAAARAKLLDLYWVEREKAMPRVKLTLAPERSPRHRATLVGDSFLEALIEVLEQVNAFESIEEFYYLTMFHESFPTRAYREDLGLDDIDWNKDVFGTRVLVLEINNHLGLPDFAKIFVTEALLRINGRRDPSAPPVATTRLPFKDP